MDGNKKRILWWYWCCCCLCRIDDDSATRTGPMIRPWEDGTSVCQLANRQINGALLESRGGEGQEQELQSTHLFYKFSISMIWQWPCYATLTGDLLLFLLFAISWQWRRVMGEERNKNKMSYCYSRLRRKKVEWDGEMTKQKIEDSPFVERISGKSWKASCRKSVNEIVCSWSDLISIWPVHSSDN